MRSLSLIVVNSAVAKSRGFGMALPAGLTNLIKRQVAAVPDDLRYYGGNPPDENRADPP